MTVQLRLCSCGYRAKMALSSKLTSQIPVTWNAADIFGKSHDLDHARLSQNEIAPLLPAVSPRCFLTETGVGYGEKDFYRDS